MSEPTGIQHDLATLEKFFDDLAWDNLERVDAAIDALTRLEARSHGWNRSGTRLCAEAMRRLRVTALAAEADTRRAVAAEQALAIERGIFQRHVEQMIEPQLLARAEAAEAAREAEYHRANKLQAEVARLKDENERMLRNIKNEAAQTIMAKEHLSEALREVARLKDGLRLYYRTHDTGPPCTCAACVEARDLLAEDGAARATVEDHDLEREPNDGFGGAV